MAEFHLHGGRRSSKAVLAALGRSARAAASPSPASSPAAPSRTASSTSRRSKASPISSTPRRKRSAARPCGRCGGALSELYEGWRAELIGASALVEAAIDFSDEGDVADAMRSTRARHRRRARRPRSPRISTTATAARSCATASASCSPGRPTPASRACLNALARRDAAIVSEEAGTTRDVIEVRLDLGGLPVIVSDTAGIREPQGADRAGGHPPHAGARARCRSRAVAVSMQRRRQRRRRRTLPARGDKCFLPLANKIDLPGAAPRGRCWRSRPRPARACDELIAPAGRHRAASASGTRHRPAITRERYRHQLNTCMTRACTRSCTLPAREHRTARRGPAHRRPRARPHHRPGRCRGHPGRDFRPLLHRQIECRCFT